MKDSENRVALAAEQKREGGSSTAAHTPGPWYEVEKVDDEVINITAESRRGYIPIATLKYGYDGHVEPEQHANARLIAAAPDMLSTLRGAREEIDLGRQSAKALLSDADKFGWAKEPIHKRIAHYDALLDVIDNSIAKAAGA